MITIADSNDDDIYAQYRNRYRSLMTDISAVLRKSISFSDRK